MNMGSLETVNLDECIPAQLGDVVRELFQRCVCLLTHVDTRRCAQVCRVTTIQQYMKLYKTYTVTAFSPNSINSISFIFVFSGQLYIFSEVQCFRFFKKVAWMCSPIGNQQILNHLLICCTVQNVEIRCMQFKKLPKSGGWTMNFYF